MGLKVARLRNPAINTCHAPRFESSPWDYSFEPTQTPPVVRGKCQRLYRDSILFWKAFSAML
jgi:hypothetical protein